MVKKYKDGVKEGKTKITVLLLDVLTTTLDVSSDADLAKRLGVKGPSISQWRNGIAAPQRDKLRAMVRALMSSFLEPLAELEPVEPTRKRKRWKLNGDASLQARLKGKCGFYLYYDSMGRVTYAGQAKKNLFGEMEQRLSQSLRHKTYMGKSAKTKPKLQQRVQGNVVRFVSAYRTLTGTAAHNFEAVFLRALANEMLTLKQGEFYWHVKKG